MPIALDPNETLEYVLVRDKDKLPPPTFVFRYVNSRQWKQLNAALKSGRTCEDSEKAMDMMLDGVRLALSSWRDMGVDYDPVMLDDILNPAEVAEVLVHLIVHTRPSGDDLGKSESQP